jgi:trigger factor
VQGFISNLRILVLKIETQPLEDHQVKLTVEVEIEQLEEAKQRAGRQLAKQVKIPGFRPGKAPFAMVLRHVGEAAILEEATELLVNDIYPKAIDEAGIEPYGPGSLDNIASMDPPTFEFVIPLKAEVELGDYRTIRLPYELEEVTEEDVDRVINDLRERQAILEPVERPAQEGDMVYIRLSGARKQAEEDKDPILVKDRPLPVVVEAEGVENSSEWPFPGFSRELIGLSAGDEKTVAHVFSEESVYESLRGIEAEFQIVVEEVKSRTLPELNDEFAQSAGEYTSLEDLRTKIYQDLENHARETYNEEYDQQVLTEVTNQSVVKYAPQMLEREIDNVIAQLSDRLSQQNLELDLYLKTRKMDIEALREESRPVAEERLKKTLVLLNLSDVEKIQVKPEEVQAETTRTLEVMSRVLSEKEARRLSDRNVVSNLVGNIMMDMVTKQTVERLRDIARGQAEKPVEEGEEEVEILETAQGEGLGEGGSEEDSNSGSGTEMEVEPAAQAEEASQVEAVSTEENAATPSAKDSPEQE